jgi:IS5 family transposase
VTSSPALATGVLEGVNSRIKVIKRTPSGYHDVPGAQQETRPGRGSTPWKRTDIAAKRSMVKAIDDPTLREITEHLEHAKASIRAVVEHPFRVLKRQFGYVKARYKGLAKNGAQVTTLFALVNLWMALKTLMQAT